MKPARTLVFPVAALLLIAGNVAAQSHKDAIRESTEQFNKFIEAAAEFVKDVRFDESDVRSVIAHSAEFDAIGDKDEADEGEDEEFVDFEKMLAYPEYRSWAKSKGLDPDSWMRKSMRIQLMMMRETLAENSQTGKTQMETQLADLEKQRAQMGEEMYRQMKQAMEMGAAAMQTASTACEKLPEPTASEKALIEKYKVQLEALE